MWGGKSLRNSRGFLRFFIILLLLFFIISFPIYCDINIGRDSKNNSDYSTIIHKYRLSDTHYSFNCPSAWGQVKSGKPDVSSFTMPANPEKALYTAIKNLNLEYIKKLIEKKPELLDSKLPEDLSPIQFACLGGNGEIVNFFISKGADPKTKDDDGRTLLHLAALSGSGDAALLLISKGIDVDVKDLDGHTPLHMASQSGNLKMVEILISKKANPDAKNNEGKTPLHDAAIGPDVELVELLISGGADPDAKDDTANKTPLHYAAGSNNLEICRILISKKANIEVKDSNGRTPLHDAVELNNIQVADTLLTFGADINARDDEGQSPLHIAVAANANETIDFLISREADINAKDKKGRTTLHHAVGNGNKKFLEFLVSKNSDLKAIDKDGRTALHYAVESGDRDLVEFLIKKGLDVKVKDKSGQTALHFAVKTGDREMVEFLISSGARVNVKDNRGRTPHKIAKEMGNKELASLTFTKGVDETISKISNFAWGPLTIILLLGAGLYFTIILKFLQFRAFPHAIELLTGKYDDPEHEGEVSHFQALSTALSATIGTGNIAGVATAIAAGGPGAVFWMWMVAVVGMLLKYASSLLAQKYRVINEDGTVSGGPMYYLEKGLKQKWLGVLFALFTVLASFGIGNMVQANSVAAPLARIFLAKENQNPTSILSMKFAIGAVLAVLTAAVIIGGIKRIGKFAEKIVPFMCIVYVMGAMFILISNFQYLGGALKSIFYYAFHPMAPVGGFAGAVVMITIRMGVARGLFSSEAGLGSAPIAHSAAKTDEPVREGLVAMLGPFIDTIVVCTMTALVIISTGVWSNGQTSSPLTVTAFRTGMKAFPLVGEYIVSFGLVFFAFSTLVSWSYYGDRSAEYLFGHKAVNVYRWIYVALIPVGAALKIALVWNISDIFNALMVFPNLIGVLGLSGMVLTMTKDYFTRKPELDRVIQEKQRKTVPKE